MSDSTQGNDTGALGALSDAIEAAVARAARSVVRVHGRRGYALSGVVFGEDVVLTTNRAVDRDGDIAVGGGAAGGEEAVRGEIVGRDPLTDLALLRAPGLGVPEATWVDAASAHVGQLVLRVSRSGGDPEATLGVVRRLGGPWRSAWGARLPVRLATDAATFRGFSGGPLATLDGRLLGIGTAVLSRSGDTVVPTETVQRVARDLLAEGRVRRGYLGVSVQPVVLPADAVDAAGQARGLLVVGVEDGGPAAGVLALGDVLLALDGEPLALPADLMGQLDAGEPGATASLRTLRGGAERSAQVVLGRRA